MENPTLEIRCRIVARIPTGIHRFDGNSYKIRSNSYWIRVGPVVGLNLLGSRIQPFDFYFNRQRKLIARRIFDYIQLDNIAINLSERNNIIHLNSLIHNQPSLSLFIPMIKYS